MNSKAVEAEGRTLRERERRSERFGHDRPGRVPSSRASADTEVLRLQQVAGNRAVVDLLGARSPLSIAPHDDAAEREADRVADDLAQETIGRPPDRDPSGSQPTAGSDPGTGEAPLGGQIQGHRLAPAERRFFERRLGRDLGDVRLHAGGPVSEAARAMRARAFTVGKNVYFGAGEYAPATRAGRHLLTHELVHAVHNAGAVSSRGVVRRKPVAAEPKKKKKAPVFADRLNVAELAQRIHGAIDRPGTDEETVYLALQRLDRDPEAIRRLKQTYQETYGTSLVADIYGDFSGEELEYALQLLGIGDPASAQAIKATPASTTDYVAAADRLRAAMDRTGTDEEAVFAVLRAFDRRKDLLLKLSIVYASKYKKHLRAEIVDEMSGSELEYALWLLGEQPIERDVARAETDAKKVLQYIRAEAQERARTPPTVSASSKFYEALRDRYLDEFLAGPTAAKGKEAAAERIGGPLKGRLEGAGDQRVVIVEPAGHPERPTVNEWEVKAITWLNRQQIPSQIQNLKDIPLFKNIRGLPKEIGAATNILAKENVTLLPFIDVDALLGAENVDLTFDADVLKGGKNISQLMHWATGVRYSDRELEAMRELFLAYEIWHLEGFDVFGQDALNDLIAEYQGLLLGKELRKGAAGAVKSEADLLPFLTTSFQEARAWVGTLLSLRQAELDRWILQKEQKKASMHYMKEKDIWHSLTIYQMLADGKSIDEVKKSFMVEAAIDIYTLIFEAQEWEAAHGPIELTPLEKALLQGKLDGLLEVMAKHEVGKASMGELLKAKSFLDDLREGEGAPVSR